MKLVIKPADNNLQTILATAEYQRIWDEFGDKLLGNFTKITGLKLQKLYIKAKVLETNTPLSGHGDKAMSLPSRKDWFYSEKHIVLAHELAHRLLLNNCLMSWHMGVEPSQNEKQIIDEIDHMTIYLFLEQVIRATYPPDISSNSWKAEQEGVGEKTPHAVAYLWIKDFDEQTRMKIWQKIAKQAIPREKWDEFDIDKVQKISPEKYKKHLQDLAKKLV